MLVKFGGRALGHGNGGLYVSKRGWEDKAETSLFQGAICLIKPKVD